MYLALEPGLLDLILLLDAYGEEAARDDDAHADPFERRELLVPHDESRDRAEDERRVGERAAHEGVAGAVGARHRGLCHRAAEADADAVPELVEANGMEGRGRKLPARAQ